jgi:glycosyltransferase involved in cell wall biosynthesis
MSFSLMKRYADLVVVLNSTTRRELVDYGVPTEKVAASSGGVNLAEIESMRPDPTVNYDACFVGRIHPGKGVFDLVDIWTKVVERRHNAKLAIIGSGSPHYLNILTEMIHSNGLDKNVKLLGFIPMPFGVMKSSKLLVYPDHEAGYGWGLAVCEALACGRPVVAYDLPVYREFFREGIYLVRFKNLVDFAEIIVRMLENDIRRNDVGQRGKDFVQRYDWGSVADHLMLEFVDMMKRSNRPENVS